MNNLITYVLAAMNSFVPVSQHSFYEKSEVTEARYQQIASTIVETTFDENKESIHFNNDDQLNRLKSALLMAAIGATESHYNALVVSCKRGGDNNVAWGIWQTHSNKKKTCASIKNQAEIAYTMIKESFDLCNKYDMLDRLSIYTDGSCHSKWDRSRYRVGLATSFFNHNKFEDENQKIDNCRLTYE